MSAQYEKEADSKVVPFAPVSLTSRQPQLTDAELIAIRLIIKSFGTICARCPTARQILSKD